MFAKKRHNVAFAWTSVIAVVVFIISWVGAMTQNPSWTIWTDTFSELGMSTAVSNYLFNIGCCMIPAAFFMIFGGACVMYTGNRDTAFTGLFVILAGIAMFFIGIFPTDVSVVHMYAAVLMGVFGFVGLCIYAVRAWNRGYMYACGISVMLAVIGVFSLFFFGFAAAEAVGLVFVTVLSVFGAKEMMFLKPAEGGA